VGASQHARRLAAHQFQQVGIFFLRHGAAASGICFGQLDKSISGRGRTRSSLRPAAKVKREHRQRVDETRWRSHGRWSRPYCLAVGASKPTPAAIRLAIDGERRSRQPPRSQRTKVCTLAAVSKPRGIRGGTFDVGKQPVRTSTGSAGCQMRVLRAWRAARRFGANEDRLKPIGDQVLQGVDAVGHKRAEGRFRDLFVAAASGMELVARLRQSARRSLLSTKV